MRLESRVGSSHVVRRLGKPSYWVENGSGAGSRWRQVVRSDPDSLALLEAKGRIAVLGRGHCGG